MPGGTPEHTLTLVGECTRILLEVLKESHVISELIDHSVSKGYVIC